VSFGAVAQRCAKAFDKQKNSRSAVREQSIERGVECLDTVQSRDKLAFWSGIKSGLFFKADSGGGGEY
jgi:hypothetical protein